MVVAIATPTRLLWRILRKRITLMGVVGLLVTACVPITPPSPVPPTPASTVPTPASVPAAPRQPTATPTAAPAATPVPLPAVAQAQVKRGGTLHLIATSEPHWDPHREQGRSNLWAYMGEFLVNFAPRDGSPVPELAQSWEFPNDTTVILNIRKGVKFHNRPPVNGREFTASDAVWNLERIRRPGATYIWRGNLERIDKIEATDKHTVKITLKSPFAPILFYLRGNYSAAQVMLAREVENKLGEDGFKVLANGVGTGPFMFKSWVPGVTGLAVRNPDYWRPGLPYMDAVDYTLVLDSATVIAAYRTGKADFPMEVGGFLSLPQKETIEKTNPNLIFTARAEAYPYSLIPNINRAPFIDIRLRKAIFLATDRDEMLRVNLGGGGHIAGPLSWRDYPGWTWSYEELMKREGYRPKNTPEGQQDIAEAQRLMREMGYGPDRRLQIQAEGMSQFPFINLTNMEVAKSELQRIGIDITIKLVDSAQWFDQDNSGDFLFRPRGFSAPSEPYGQLFTRHHSMGGRNTQRLKDADFDKLVDEARGTLDVEKRKKLIIQAQERLWSLYPQVWLHVRDGYIPQQKWVRGLEPTSFRIWGDPATTWLDKN